MEAVWRGRQDTDYNGIVLFEPAALRELYGGRIRRGANLFRRFTKTDDGDRVLERGIVVPILAIDDAGYSIVIREEGERSPVERWIVATNGVFPFWVRHEAVLADLAIFREWEDQTDWQRVPIPPGKYGVTIRGFRRMSSDRKKIIDAGYELVLSRARRLPSVTGSTAARMRTLTMPSVVTDGRSRASR